MNYYKFVKQQHVYTVQQILQRGQHWVQTSSVIIATWPANIHTGANMLSQSMCAVFINTLLLWQTNLKNEELQAKTGNVKLIPLIFIT